MRAKDGSRRLLSLIQVSQDLVGLESRIEDNAIVSAMPASNIRIFVKQRRSNRINLKFILAQCLRFRSVEV